MSVVANLDFCFLFEILVLRSREMVIPLPAGIIIESFYYEDVTSLLSRQLSSEYMSSIMYCSQFLISLCFITFWLPQLFMFNDVKISSQNVGATMINSWWCCYNCWELHVYVTTITLELNGELLLLLSLFIHGFIGTFSVIFFNFLFVILNSSSSF